MNLNLEILQEINEIRKILEKDISHASFYYARIEQLEQRYIANNQFLFDKTEKGVNYE